MFYVFVVTFFISTVSSNRWQRVVFGRKCTMSWVGVQGAPALLLALVDTMKSKGRLCFQKKTSTANCCGNNSQLQNMFHQARAAIRETHKGRGRQTPATQQTTKTLQAKFGWQSSKDWEEKEAESFRSRDGSWGNIQKTFYRSKISIGDGKRPTYFLLLFLDASPEKSRGYLPKWSSDAASPCSLACHRW